MVDLPKFINYGGFVLTYDEHEAKFPFLMRPLT